MGLDEFVCGPTLKYRNVAAESGIFDKQVSDDGVWACARHVSRCPLLWPGPSIDSFKIDGSGLCGSAPVIHYSVYHLIPFQGKRGTVYEHIKHVHGGGTMIGCEQSSLADFDVVASPSLDVITEYRRPFAVLDVTPGARGRYVAEPCKPSAAPAPKGVIYEAIKEWLVERPR